MTSTLMEDLSHPFSMTKALRTVLGGLILAASPLIAPAGTVCGAAATSGAYPSFCSIPATPGDIRPPEAFHAAVLDIRLAGRRVMSDAAGSGFGLPIGADEAFAADARLQATPPAPMPGLADADTAAFAASARAKASPPAKSRK